MASRLESEGGDDAIMKSFMTATAREGKDKVI